MIGGLLFGFGVYQAFYESMHSIANTPFTGASAAEVDLVGSLSTSLLTIGAPIAVGWAKTFSPKLVVGAGGLVFGVAHILASFGKELWHAVGRRSLLVGFCTGLGARYGSPLAFRKGGVVWYEQNLANSHALSGDGEGTKIHSTSSGSILPKRRLLFTVSYAKTLGLSDTDGANLTVLYGLFASAFVSLFSPVLMELFGIERFLVSQG